MILIAEIGNNHFGSMEKAKELIKAAKDSGATLVKSQAFLPCDINGSMPKEFYMECAFTYNKYLELIDYARDIKIDLFYSIFSPELLPIKNSQKFHKVSASQTLNMTQKFINQMDLPNTFFSINQNEVLPEIRFGKVLYATDYLKDPNWTLLTNLRRHYFTTIGYSDHSIGIDNCIDAHYYFGSRVIEKHFTIDKENTYRDIVHGSTPKEFCKLAIKLGLT